MFYKKGIDITNDKQMFEFLAGHFTYPTMNFHNYLYSIANKVKLYDLCLSGDWCVALSLLENGEYETLEIMINDWELAHPGYEVYFNGRSGGYLILKAKDSNGSILPDDILESDNYEDYKSYCRHYYGSVKANRDDLVSYTNLVRDFDKLCDELRDYCDGLSQLNFEVVEMEKAVDDFNERYGDDLELLGFEPLQCDNEGKVNVSEIKTLICLSEAFNRIVHSKDGPYDIIHDENGYVYYSKSNL